MSLAWRLKLLAIAIMVSGMVMLVLHHRVAAQLADELRDMRESHEQIVLLIAIDGGIEQELVLRQNATSQRELAAVALLVRDKLGELERATEGEDDASELRMVGELRQLQRTIEDKTEVKGSHLAVEDLVAHMIAREQHQIDDAHARLARSTTLFTLVALALLAAMTAVIVFSIVAPLRRYFLHLTRATRRIAQGDLSTRVMIHGPRDLHELGSAVDAMRRDLHAERERVDDHVDELERRAKLLRSSEARSRALFDRSPVPMWVCDRETRQLQAVNGAFAALLGYPQEELLAMRITDLIEGGLYRCRNGKHVELETSSHTLAIEDRPCTLSVGIDVTEAHKLEAALRQAQKMEAIGQLAGGVAHDFNNILAVIEMNAELLGEELGPDHPSRGDADEIRLAAARGASLTRQLLAFSRKQAIAPKSLELNTVVGDLRGMLGRIVGEQVVLSIDLDAAAGVVHADSGQLEQVVMNLVVNARDAMPDGGQITITTSRVDLDATAAARRTIAPGPYAVLSVADTGCGMDEATQAHIFEPFFTTKEVGRGTGLGLATVFAIVQRCGGAVEVASKPGQGATFHIYMPRTADRAEVIGIVRPVVVRGAATILLVEDDDQLRSATCRLLLSLGYRCIDAHNASSALELVLHARERIDVLLTDLVMPGLDGRALASRVRMLRPEVKVLLMSGYTEHPTIKTSPLPGENFIAKPFSGATLSDALQDAIGRQVLAASA